MIYSFNLRFLFLFHSYQMWLNELENVEKKFHSKAFSLLLYHVQQI